MGQCQCRRLIFSSRSSVALAKHRNSYGEYFLYGEYDGTPVYQHFAGTSVLGGTCTSTSKWKWSGPDTFIRDFPLFRTKPIVSLKLSHLTTRFLPKRYIEENTVHVNIIGVEYLYKRDGNWLISDEVGLREAGLQNQGDTATCPYR